ncbi:MAG: formimidoylglutamase [Anaerolineae bacterium]|jgi:formiminoglutamase|nr:formimidoylglutamase [Anaerolineae bacterium]
MSDLFRLTQPPDPSVFYHRDDPNDPRLGEHVRSNPSDYESARVVLLGCPQDEGVKRNGGRVGASEAPHTIRLALYRLTMQGLHASPLFDLGNTLIQATLEQTHDLHQTIVEQVLRDGKRLIVLGGGNDLSYPDCSGLANVFNPVLAFNVDAHYDVRADTPRNSGTPYRQLLEAHRLTGPNFYEMGNHPFTNSAIYTDYLEKMGVAIHSLAQLRAQGLISTFEAILKVNPAPAIFWGIDMDVVRASDAPGVSAPTPIGLTAEELYALVSLAGQDPRSKLLEITEVNPSYDQDGRTSRLASLLIYAFLAAQP